MKYFYDGKVLGNKLFLNEDMFINTLYLKGVFRYVKKGNSYSYSYSRVSEPGYLCR